MYDFLYLKNVVTLELDIQKCSGCKMCTIVCPHEVFIIHDRKAYIQRKDFCMECGACEKNCPDKAIRVRSGVGCAAGVLNGLIKGTEPNCSCSGSGNVCC